MLKPLLFGDKTRRWWITSLNLTTTVQFSKTENKLFQRTDYLLIDTYPDPAHSAYYDDTDKYKVSWCVPKYLFLKRVRLKNSSGKRNCFLQRATSVAMSNFRGCCKIITDDDDCFYYFKKQFSTLDWGCMQLGFEFLVLRSSFVFLFRKTKHIKRKK